MRPTAIRILPFLLGAVAMLVAGWGLPRGATADAPTKRYRDPVHKFSFMVYPDWDQIPIEAGEETDVAKFCQKGDRGGPFQAPSLTVVRILKGDKTDAAVTPGEGDGPKDPREAFRDAMKPKTAWDATISNINTKKENLPSPDKFKAITSDDKIEGKIWEFEVPIESRYVGEKDPILFVALATFEKDKVEYGLFFRGGKNEAKKLKSGFEQMAKSFRFFDDQAKDVASLPVLDGVNITPARRRQIERGQIKGWDVIVSPKKNYVVIYNTKNGKNKELGKVIAERIEQIRAQVYEKQFPPAAPITAVSICRVCKDGAEYYKYGGPGGSAGYWNSGSEELVFYDASPAKKIDDDTLAVLYHEAFHQFIFYSVGEVAPHSWFNEGHGDYYAGAKYKGGKFVIGPFDWRVGTVKGAIVQGPRTFTLDSKGEKQWGKEGYTPLEDLVRFSQGEYYSYPGVSYAQGWSLVYFLREVVPKNKKWNEKWGKILETYFNTLKAEVNKGGALKPGGDAKPEPGGDGPDDPGGDDEPTPPAPTPPEPTPPDGKEPPGPAKPPDGPAGPGGPPSGPDGPPANPDDPSGGFQIPQTMFRGLGGDEALKKAVDAAFKGIDWAEFEKAWKESTKQVNG